MDLNDYLEPVSLEKPPSRRTTLKASFGGNITVHTPDRPVRNVESFSLALLGVEEERGSKNLGTADAPDLIRAELYQLSLTGKKTAVIDLGNLKKGNSLRDRYAALRDVASFLLSKQVIPIILGGSQDLTYSLVQACQQNTLELNLVTIDSKLDFRRPLKNFDADSYLNPLVLKRKAGLFHFTNLGHQQYFLVPGDLESLEKHHFESHGLGQIRSSLKAVEPILRDADLVSIDICSVKQADAPGYFLPCPNGFQGEEICQLGKYAGLSNRVRVFGIFEVNPAFDHKNQTSLLAAEIIWYFIDGYSRRIPENPSLKSSEFTRYVVNLSPADHRIHFYQSNQTERWWMEVPGPGKEKRIIPCSHDDYLAAGNQEIPERWLKFFRKLN